MTPPSTTSAVATAQLEIADSETPPAGQPCTLYRFFAADGSLLYVGISLSTLSRWLSHRKKTWWLKVASAALEHFPSQDAAAVAEIAAIIAERPRWNVRHLPVGAPISVESADVVAHALTTAQEPGPIVEWLRIQEVAELLGVGRSTVHNWITRDLLRAWRQPRPSGEWRVSEASAQALGMAVQITNRDLRTEALDRLARFNRLQPDPPSGKPTLPELAAVIAMEPGRGSAAALDDLRRRVSTDQGGPPTAAGPVGPTTHAAGRRLKAKPTTQPEEMRENPRLGAVAKKLGISHTCAQQWFDSGVLRGRRLPVRGDRVVEVASVREVEAALKIPIVSQRDAALQELRRRNWQRELDSAETLPPGPARDAALADLQQRRPTPGDDFAPGR